MQENTVLQKFQKFKAMILSADIPNDLLLELAESYMTAEDAPAAEVIPILDGQMSLLDMAA